MRKRNDIMRRCTIYRAPVVRTKFSARHVARLRINQYYMPMRYRALLSIWLLSDLVLFTASYALAYFMRVGWIFSSDFPFSQFILIVALIAPLWLMVLITTRTFALTRNQTNLRNFAYIIYACVVGVAFFTIGYYFWFEAFFSRLLLVGAFMASAIVISTWHVFYQQILRHLLRRNPPRFPTLIIGVTRESKRLIELLEKGKNPLKPVAILDGRGTSEKEVFGVPVKGKLNKLEEVLQGDHITHLIQCSDLEQSLNLLSACRKRNITYVLLPSVLGIVERDERVESLEGQPVTMVGPQENGLMWFFR